MKNTLFLLAAVLIFGWVLTSCSESSQSSDIKTNKYVGELPSIIANKELAEKKLRAEAEEKSGKLTKQDKEKIIAMMNHYKKKDDAIKEKFQSLWSKEIAKISNREIPFKYSEALSAENPFFSIEIPIKVEIIDQISVSFAAKVIASESFTFPVKNYYWAYAKCINSQGKAIFAHKILLGGYEYKPITITAGSIVKEWAIHPSLYQNTKYWGDFAQIVFCTEEEYKIAYEEYKAQSKEDK